ncbi:MAG TPA: DNA-deoxyinosine glycosylase, partial [Steroidobacteraceae bacterium]
MAAKTESPRRRGGRPQWVRGLPPIAGRDARILILGSMPGVASIRAAAYYAHPRNHFWPILAALYGIDLRLSYADRVARLIRARVAVWDVLGQCARDGSLDAAIELESAVANDLGKFLRAHRAIQRIAFKGALARQHFRRQWETAVLAVRPTLQLLALPSTSP